MPIELPEHNSGGNLPPVLKRRRIGETFRGALAESPLQRDQTDGDGNPKLKPNGRPRQELVLTFVTISSDMIAGLAGEESVPAPGAPVRCILRGRAYGDWIEANNALRPRRIGDIVELTTDRAVRYDANGTPVGPELTTQAEVDAIPRSQTVGMYGTLTLRRATADEATSVQLAEAHYLAATSEVEPPSGGAPVEEF